MIEVRHISLLRISLWECLIETLWWTSNAWVFALHCPKLGVFSLRDPPKQEEKGKLVVILFFAFPLKTTKNEEGGVPTQKRQVGNRTLHFLGVKGFERLCLLDFRSSSRLSSHRIRGTSGCRASGLCVVMAIHNALLDWSREIGTIQNLGVMPRFAKSGPGPCFRDCW